MLHDIHFPESLSGAALDAYLEKGWYRMGQVIFTTNYIVYEEELYRVFWLRYAVAAIRERRSHEAIRKRNRHFHVQIRLLEITDEMEALYSRYKTAIDFDAPESVAHFLQDGGTGNIYQTYAIELRDADRLIGVGVFDLGDNSMAGILNFYDPDYRQCSVGKYLILLKVDEARKRQLQWYYPGYIVAGHTRFDYKLFLGEEIAQLYFPEYDRWLTYQDNWPGVQPISLDEE